LIEECLVANTQYVRQIFRFNASDYGFSKLRQRAHELLYSSSTAARLT